ncbi:MAG: molybdenum cofactor biosynthesis protein MoaA [Myxococcales bacterium]|nr:molybdenum cofactor biosynthesis protein MoaA [Myxococcales bacterium]
MTDRASLEEIASCVAGYDPKALPVAQAQEFIARLVPRVRAVEKVALRSGLGRVLAHDVVSATDVPSHDNSAMDGYALRTADAFDGATLRVIGEVAAGQVATRTLVAGEAYRIMTGAPIPPGADAVIMQEQCERRGDEVTLKRAVKLRDHVRDRGEDVRAGEVVLRRGLTLRAAEVGTLASARRARVAVTRRPIVALLATGDELRDVGEPLDPGAIPDTNSYALAALVREAGGEPRQLPIVRDDRAALAAAMREARSADLIVSTGGVSVGEHDHVKAVLEELGAELTAWRVDMKPGKPVALAVLDGTPYYGLPGNPVSSMVAFTLFVRPAIRAALGCTEPLDLARATVRLEAPLTVRGERRQFLRARVRFADGRLVAAPMARQGSGVLSSMLGANGLIVVDAGMHSFDAGAEASVLIIGPLGRD